jgi:hypothetical protein
MQQRKAEWSILLTTLPILEVFFFNKKIKQAQGIFMKNANEYFRGIF